MRKLQHCKLLTVFETLFDLLCALGVRGDGEGTRDVQLREE